MDIFKGWSFDALKIKGDLNPWSIGFFFLGVILLILGRLAAKKSKK